MMAAEWPLLAGDEDLEAIGGGVGSSLCESGHSALPIELGSIPHPFRLSVQFKSIGKSFFFVIIVYMFLVNSSFMLSAVSIKCITYIMLCELLGSRK